MIIHCHSIPNLKIPKANGFSFIELMVAVVIMGLLTSVVVLNVLPSQNRAMVEKPAVMWPFYRRRLKCIGWRPFDIQLWKMAWMF